MSQIQTAHRSTISQHSTHSRSYSLQDVFELTDEELIQSINETKYQLKLVQIENEILEKAIMRLEPSLMQNVSQAMELATNIIISNSSIHMGSISRTQASKFDMSISPVNPSRIVLSPSRASTRRVDSSARLGGTVIFSGGPKINVLEKSELVSIEIENVLHCIEKVRKNAAKQQAFLKAQLEEIGVQMVNMEKAENMFHQDVIVDGWDKIAQRIPAEIWIRFMTEWVKICDSQIGKLRLRTSTLNTQHRKLRGQIKVKAELSEKLRPVDFQKLEIENKEAEKLIEHQLVQLVELKRLTGDANLNLARHKKALMAQNNYLNHVVKSIKQREHMTVQLDKEKGAIASQADNLADKLSEVRQVRNAYEVPDVMDYVNVIAECTDLKKSIKMLQNRLRIKQIALASLHRQIQYSMLMLEEKHNLNTI